MSRPVMKNKKGFTLVELMVVMSIISLMSSLVFASINTARARARDSARYSAVQQMRNAIELYITKYGHAPFIQGKEVCGSEKDFTEFGTEVNDCTAREFDTGYQTIRSDNWSLLQSELIEFIPSLPKDPCGQSCSDGTQAYRYHYFPPATLEFLCQCNLSDSDYAFFAERLEGNGQASYFTVQQEFSSL